MANIHEAIELIGHARCLPIDVIRIRADGLMDVVLIRGGSVVDMIEIVGNAVLGNYLESEQVVHRQVRHWELDSNPPMRFTVDGEIINREPVEFDVIPAAIRMFVGDDFVALHHAPHVKHDE